MKYIVKANSKDYIVDVKKKNVNETIVDSAQMETYSDVDDCITDEIRSEIEHLFYEDNENNTYKIRDYFKNTPSAFLTIVSMFFACCAFIAGMIEYIAKYQYCSYWGISIDYIRISGIMPFTLAIAVIAALLIVCLPKVFVKEFETIALYSGVRYMYLRRIEAVRKQSKQIQNETRHMRAILKKSNKNIKKPDDFMEYKSIKLLEKENKRIYKIGRRVLRHGTRRTIKSYVKISLYTFVIVISVYIFFIAILGNQKVEILVPIIIIISILFGTWFRSRNKYQMRIVELVKKIGMDDNPSEELIMIVEKTALNQMDKVRNANTNMGYFFSDARCKKLARAFIAVTFIFIVANGLINSFSVSRQNRFDIAIIEEKKYAVMMFLDEQYLLKPIDISSDGRVATIAYDELRIEDESFNMQKMEFQEVKKQ